MEKPIELARLKQMIKNGIDAIPQDTTSQSAVLVIGDTGVGKSTILSFLSGAELFVRFDGLKPRLDNRDNGFIKIGHQKYSQTSIPTKIIIENMAFYDCPGFKDNKGQEYEISNSFFIQRLLNIYKKVKLILIVDQTHISEARADKFPKLIKNLLRAFKTFEDIKDGVILIVNRAERDQTLSNYVRQLQKMIEMKGERSSLFEPEEKQFVKFLIKSGKMFLFRSPRKQQKDKKYIPPQEEKGLIKLIKNCKYVTSKQIQNILSESAKLAIRDFIDQITNNSNMKIQILCNYIVSSYNTKTSAANRDLKKMFQLKQGVIGLAEEVKDAKAQNILNVLQKQVPKNKIQEFQEDYSAVMFFKNIYDKTSTYFSNIRNKIYSELAHLLTKMDKTIVEIQKNQQQMIQRKKREEKLRMIQQNTYKQRQNVNMNLKRMQEIKLECQNLYMSDIELREQLMRTLEYLNGVKKQFNKVKQDVINIQNFDKQLKKNFSKVQATYFSEQTIKVSTRR